ncbi:MAG: hypothetical protein WDO69_00885 [Pseudomonadota bacterium]
MLFASSDCDARTVEHYRLLEIALLYEPHRDDAINEASMKSWRQSIFESFFTMTVTTASIGSARNTAFEIRGSAKALTFSSGRATNAKS